MAIDDAAGRRAVRERRLPKPAGESVFSQQPRNSPHSKTPVVVVRDDVHQRGLTAARKALREALRSRTDSSS
jgi:hypothetical protein